jgi:preprotein translocase subunit YajC
MNNLINLIMMGGQPSSTGGQPTNPYSTFIMLGLIIVVFYFFMIRPQTKRQKELRNFRDSLAKGDRIITTGGIYGKIVSISNNVATIDVGNGINLKIDVQAILKDSSDIQAEQKN